MKQTAVEFLEEQLKVVIPINQFNDLLIQNAIQEAKKKEKEAKNKLKKHKRQLKDYMKSTFKIKLKIKGTPPNFMKVITKKGDDYGVVYVGNNKEEFKRTDLKISGIEELRLYEQVYLHISGNDIGHWMLFELKEDKLNEYYNETFKK